MKLQEEALTIQQQLSEFDQWLTPKLERTKDSVKFSLEIKALCDTIKILASNLDNFNLDNKSIDNLVNTIIISSQNFVRGIKYSDDEASVAHFYESIFNLLFLVTGATDNNLKNHFLIKLKEDGVVQKIPKRSGGKKIKFKLTPIPSTTKSDYIAKALAACYVGSSSEYVAIVKTEPSPLGLSVYLESLLKEYVSLVLEDEDDVSQLWVVGSSFMALNEKSEEMAKLLINSCTIFKVRGSVSATGGHIPENIMRTKLNDIGLVENIDYNTSDVVVGTEIIKEKGKTKPKTRAYDFALPYNVPEWDQHLFIQSQFYAGDSGSVSHKVIDQTTASRVFTLSKKPHARFVEYLDGAGYYASLRGDLTKMLELEDTSSFIQVKSILVRLRRQLQEISFLTPVEFEHAILRTDSGDVDEVTNILKKEGYSSDEIIRVEKEMISRGLLNNDGSFVIMEDRKSYTRMLYILDCAANNSNIITDQERQTGSYILTPGFGSNYGIKASQLARIACKSIRYLTVAPHEYEEDLEALLEEQVITRK